MTDKVLQLLRATKNLISYIEENQVYDKLSDCGCGLYDSYRSDAFEAVITATKKALRALEQELAASSGIGVGSSG